MAATGLPRLGELRTKDDGGFVHAEFVGVHPPPGQDECVVVGRLGVGDQTVDFDAGSPVGLVPAFDLAVLDGKNVDLGAGVLEVLLGLGQFGLLEAVGGEDGDLSCPISRGFIAFDDCILGSES